MWQLPLLDPVEPIGMLYPRTRSNRDFWVAELDDDDES
jgi:hypothetical protein